MDQTEKLNYGPENRNRKGQKGKWKGKTCCVDGCNEPVSSRGYCAKHYGQKMWADGHRSPTYNSEYRRNVRLKARYGITLAEYEAMFEAQGGKCAICGQPPGDNVRAHWGGKLCIDHCHETNTVRGLLCNDCNLAVGYAKTEATALAVAEYFRLHNRTD
jgi:hypothetical protein